MTTYEKIVKGATKLKVAAPKPKYIEPILMATSMDHQVSSENLATIVKTLHQRLQDNSWSVVYKSLLVFHIMIREGDRDVTLKYLSERSPNIFKISGSNIANGSVFNTDARFIVKYSRYLQSRVDNFAATRVDYVRDERINNSINQSGGRLRNLKIERGLLRECESVQSQIDALLKNSFLEAEIKNDIILTAFRLLVNDLLALFQEMNEGVINLLEHYFEMSYVDAERALSVYKKFVDQTKYVIDYLRVAKHLEYATKLHVPTIKHAPTALTSSLEEYLHDPAFEQHRSEYIIKKKQGLNSDKPVSSPLEKSGVGQKHQQQQQQQLQQLQQQQQQLQQLQQQQLQQQQLQQQQLQQQQLQQQQLQQQQQPGLQIQQHPNQIQQMQQQQQQQAQSELQRRGTLLVQQTAINPWGNSMPASFTNNNPQFLVNQANTGAGFGNGQPPFSAPQQQAQTTGNPFAVSMPQPDIQQYTGFQQPTSNSGTWNAQLSPSQPMERQNTNPFAALSSTVTGNQPQVDKTNPFGGTRFSNANTTAFTFQQGNTPDKASVTATGSNPFKVSNTTTNVFDSAYQKTESQPLKPQPTAGGLENLPTLAVFPETQREQSRNTYIANAQQNLASQATGQFNQQYAGQMQYQQPQMAQMTQGQYSNQPMPQQTGIYNGPSLI